MKTLAALVLASFAVLSWPNAADAQFRQMPGVRVRAAPPALRVEVAPVAPSLRHLWIGGYWGWRAGAHAWIGGHWALPPQPGYVWEPARWENIGGAWMFYEGHWRTADIPVQEGVYQPPAPPLAEVLVGTPPPAPIEEIHPAIPFAGALWIPGYWHWQGNRHVWVGGRWSAPPAGHAWEAHRWEKRPDGHWAQRPGHWHPR